MSSDEDIFKSTIQNQPSKEKSNALLDEVDDENFFQSTMSKPSTPLKEGVASRQNKNHSPDTNEANSTCSLGDQNRCTNVQKPQTYTGDDSAVSVASITPNKSVSSPGTCTVPAPSSFLDDKDSFESFKQTFKIEVRDPQKRVDAMGSYMTYEVQSIEVDISEDSLKADKVIKVRRRYNDFKWLYDSLSAGEPFRFLGPLPPKGLIAMDRFGQDFIAERMSLLNDFIQCLSKHPVISASKIFQTFITCQLDFKAEALKHLGIVNPVSATNTGLAFLTNTLTNALNSRQRDPDFQDFYEYICLYKERLQYALRVSNRVLRETEDAQRRAKDMPNYLKKLTELEESADSFSSVRNSSTNEQINIFKTDKSLKDNLDKFYETVTNCSDSYNEIVNFLKNKLIHFLELQERICGEIFTALSNRDKVQFDLQNVQEDCNKTKLNNNQLHFQANYGANDQMEKARMAHQIQALDMKITTVQKNKQQADSVIRSEMNFWKNNKTVGLKDHLAEMSLRNVKNLDSQLAEYEKLLAALK